MTQVHILLTNGTGINLDTPPDFDFATWVNNIRAAGFLFGPNLYVALPHVAAFVLVSPDTTIQVRPAGATVQ